MLFYAKRFGSAQLGVMEHEAFDLRPQSIAPVMNLVTDVMGCSNHFTPGVCALVCSEDNLGRTDKDKMIWLATELVAEAKYKIHQTDGIREEHAYFMSFEIGYIMGTIRENYKMMMEIYRIIWNRYTERQRYSIPKIWSYRPIHYLVMMEYIVMTEMEIDKMVNIIEKMPEDKGKGFFSFRAVSDESSNEEERKRVQLEEQVKSQYRQQYLMRKLSSPARSTTKKRFIQDWPVDGTWSLEKY